MKKFIFITFISILLFSSIIATCSAYVQVGVKDNQWVEYNVSSTGLPMRGHDVTWARMQILYVNGSKIEVSITSKFDDNSIDTTNHTLNLETGHLIDSFIIPANLKIGETFKDENLGIVTISKVEESFYAGANRMVVSASVANNTYNWDQATGVSVEGDSRGSNWTIHTVISKTNLWQPTVGIDWLIVGLAILFVILIIFAIITIRKHHMKSI